MLSLRPLKRAKRWLFGKRSEPQSLDPRAYERWLEARIQSRSSKQPCIKQPGLFSILTCVYHRSPVEFLRETSHSVLTQSYTDFQWVVLAQGSLSSELERVLTELESDVRVKLLRIPENLGIFRGLHECLAAATGRYALPLDGDDLLTIDALELMARAISQHDEPAFLYSDEDMFVEGQPQTPYLRPDWDPVLNISCSYVWHLCAFDASLARQLGVYADAESEWCQDWHSIFRFVDAGYRPVHVAEVLYHWRAHPQSSTHQAVPHDGSLNSQRHLLAAQVARQSAPELYKIEPFPVFRGAQEWWIRREHVRPQPLGLVYYADASESLATMTAAVLDTLRASQFPFGSIHLVSPLRISDEQKRELIERFERIHREFGLSEPPPQIFVHPPSADVFQLVAEPMVAVLESGIQPDGQEWPWEAQGLFELHADVAMVAGRIINSKGVVCGGGEIFGFGGLSNCLESGRLAHEPGPFALLLKQRSVDAVNAAFFLARTSFLRGAKNVLSSAASRRSLGIWLGAMAAREGMRVAATPLVAARLQLSRSVQSALASGEGFRIQERFGAIFNASRCYSPHASRSIRMAYEFGG